MFEKFMLYEIKGKGWVVSVFHEDHPEAANVIVGDVIDAGGTRYQVKEIESRKCCCGDPAIFGFLVRRLINNGV